MINYTSKRLLRLQKSQHLLSYKHFSQEKYVLYKLLQFQTLLQISCEVLKNFIQILYGQGLEVVTKEIKSVISWRNKKCDNSRLLSATVLESVMVHSYHRPFMFIFINKITQPFYNHFTIWSHGHINFLIQISGTSAVFLPAFP